MTDGSTRSTPTTPWRPVVPRSRLCEKNRSPPQICTRPRPGCRRRPRLRAPAAPPATGRPSRPDHVLAEPAPEHVADVVAHLVAARPRARPDRGGRPAGHRLDPALDDPGHEPPPAGVKQRQAAPVRSRDATGRQSAVSSTSGRAGQARRRGRRTSGTPRRRAPGTFPGAGSSPTSRTSAPCTCQAIVAASRRRRRLVPPGAGSRRRSRPRRR